MKNSLKRLLSLLMVLTLLFALVPAVLAAEEDDEFWDDYSWENEFGQDYFSEGNPFGGDGEYATGLSVPQVSVFIPTFELPMTVNDRTSVTAIVTDADSGASYEWKSADPSIVSVAGSKETVSVTALKPGETQVTLTVTRGDGLSSDYDFFYVTVTNPSTPVSVSGGGSVSMDAGDTRTLSAGVSGGSGSYEYEWDAGGGAALRIVSENGGSANVYAGDAGSGWVTLTAFDRNDYTNNKSVQWNLTVQASSYSQPPELEMDRGSIDLGPGASGSLHLLASGGSGSYEYIWSSDNPSVVSVTGNGATADVRASSTVLPNGNTAQISAHVRDTQTGLSSKTVSCLVAVSGGNATYNASASASAGNSLSMDPIAGNIDSAFRSNFGVGINYSASVKFESPSTGIGSLRLQDDTMVYSGTSYTFASFQDMVFKPSGSGRFSTGYMIVDGGNTMYGTISIDVSGGIGVTDASIAPGSLTMGVYANQYLTLSVAPANASYSVSWSSENTGIVSAAGNGNKVTLLSGASTGSTTITATITDVNGSVIRRSCNITVVDNRYVDPNVYYDTSITVMLGSDYYGSKLADSMTSKFRSAFNVYPADGASIIFPSLGNSRYGTLHMRDGSLTQEKRSYTFRDWIDMYFVPSAAGTYTMSYQLSYRNNTMLGEVKIIVQSANISVSLNPSSIQMSTYSNQYINLSVTPATAYYRVSWISSDSKIATVSGNNASAVVTSVAPGTATIFALVTDGNGVELRRSCTVMVNSSGTSFNPSVSTTLGIPYVGTGTSTAMRSQFQAVYGMTLGDNAVIRFASTGNTDVGVLRLSDGSMIRPNTDYTLSQYVAMYTQPVTAGTYSVPYTLTYAGKTMNGTVSVVINGASISTDLTLPSRAAYCFFDPLSVGSGGGIFADSIRNTVGTGCSYLRFGKVCDSTGTLFQDRAYTGLTTNTNVQPSMLSQLYFVPGEMSGTFSAPYTVYASNGSVLATGSLNINAQGITFSDVPAGAYYAPAVDWAVSRGITSGTGGSFFSPDMPVTRGQAMTFLWRAAGMPSPTFTNNPFTDVAAGSYYYDAVLWAVQQGITNGISDTAFGPDLSLRRDQLLTFLCRSNGGYAGGDDWSNLAVNWASQRGLLAGIPGTFVAADICPRSDVVYYLWKNYNG